MTHSQETIQKADRLRDLIRGSTRRAAMPLKLAARVIGISYDAARQLLSRCPDRRKGSRSHASERRSSGSASASVEPCHNLSQPDAGAAND
jgi:hypothetical protein